MNKTDALESLLLLYDPHVCVVTETWLHDNIRDDEIAPPGYCLYRRDRGSRGGGVAVLAKHSVDIAVGDQIADHESLLLNVCFCGIQFYLCAVYRPPDSNDLYLSKLHEHLLSLRDRNVILTGDFNLPEINWDQLKYGCSTTIDVILDVMFCLNLEQMVRQCTRGKSILDLLFITEIFNGASTSVEPGISDHDLIYFCWQLTSNRPKLAKYSSFVWDFQNADDVSVIDYLDIHLDFAVDNIETSWMRFRDAINFCVTKFTPAKVLKKRRVNPWITRDIIHTKRKIKRLRKQKKMSCSIYLELKQNLLMKLRESRSAYFNNCLSQFIKCDSQKFWRFLKESRQDVSKIKIGDMIATDARQISEHFNHYFHSVFSRGDSYAPQSTDSCLADDLAVSHEGVVSMLLNVNPKKPTGPDGIPNAFLHRYAEQVSRFLTDFFNLSIATGEIPDDWRLARITPIHKKGDRLSVNNYRPISITSTCCKLLEHVISKYLIDFLEKRNALSPYQHGFRKNLSTVTQLVTTVHDFSHILDMTGQVDALFLDFSKAFDKVPHGKLLRKLEYLGVPSNVVKWIGAYLRDRRQFVQVSDHSSELLYVTSGVPQGSVLGPLLFLIYINDLADLINNDVCIRLFADDCVVFKEIRAPNDHVLLQENLQAIGDWCIRWDMELNTEKSVLLRITRKKMPSTFSYSINQRDIEEVDKCRYLGVTINNKLTWSTHISATCTSALQKLWFLKRKLKTAPPRVKLLAYNTFVRTKLEYASIVWDPHNKSDVQELERVQRKAVRFIFNKYRMTDSPSLLMKQHNIPSLESRRKVSRLTFLQKCLTGNTKVTMPDCVRPHSTRKTRHTHSRALAPIFAKTKSHKYSFFPRTVSEWNALPSTVVDANDFVRELENLYFVS